MDFRFKYLRTVLLSAVISIALSMTAFAANARINFSDPEVTAGSEVNVTMKITADSGTKLKDATVVITYPTEKLEFVSGTDSDGGAGAVRIHGTTNGGGTSLLEYNLKFNTISAGSALISVDSYEIYDSSDQPLTITHVGNSAVTINPADEASSDSTLVTLEVYPGELTPEFSADVGTYSVDIGTAVDRLTINAIPNDSSSSVTIEGNEEIPDGDSAVTITVNASDGVTTSVYTINVSKVDGGPESVISETESEETVEGVQLSSKGKTITIINPGEDVEIPEGFKQGTIKIDDQKVQGWVWGADDEPEYCVVYGVNDSGELNFYRYDMVEKTIQRYFEDPIAAGAVSASEYAALEAVKDAAENNSNQRFMIICILAAIIFILLMVIIGLIARIRTLSRRNSASNSAFDRYRKRQGDDTDDEVITVPSVLPEGSARRETDKTDKSPADDRYDGIKRAEELLKHDYKAETAAQTENQAADETVMIKRSKRKRRPRHVSPEAIPDASGGKPDERAEAPYASGPEDSSGDGSDIEDLDI